MKAKMILSVLTLLTVTNAFAGIADEVCGGHGTCTSVVSSSVVTFSPTVLVSAPFYFTSQTLQNDLVQVQDDAVIALETGVISSELKSVVDKVRADYHEDTKEASDIEVVEMVFGETK